MVVSIKFFALKEMRIKLLTNDDAGAEPQQNLYSLVGEQIFKIYKWNLHGGKTTMLYLNLSGHDIFKKRFVTSPEKHCLTAMPYRLFQGNLRN